MITFLEEHVLFVIERDLRKRKIQTKIGVESLSTSARPKSTVHHYGEFIRGLKNVGSRFTVGRYLTQRLSNLRTTSCEYLAL